MSIEMTEPEQTKSYLKNFKAQTKVMTRRERIEARNDIIMTEWHAGKPKEEIAERFQISIRQLDRIIFKIEQDAKDWYTSLPKKTMIAIHRDNSIKVYNEIRTLKALRRQVDDNNKKFSWTVDIIDAYAKYDKMVAEGATLQRQKELTEEAERIVAAG